MFVWNNFFYSLADVIMNFVIAMCFSQNMCYQQ